MKALRNLKADAKSIMAQMTKEELSPGEVLIRSHFSGLNYKDALAVTAKGKILKSFPLNPGIDVSGVVESDASGTFKPGDKVLVTGSNLGEEMDGGFGEFVRLPKDIVIPLPEGFDLKHSMFLGTAGFTAALAIHRMLENNQTKDKGPILVTGATGGVSSFSIALLSHLGFEAWAMTGKKDQAEYLRSLGATKVVSKEDLELGHRPLEKAKFGGVIDSVGGKTLSQLLAHVGLWGNVASIGLAEGLELHTTVMPFILRGVSLLGVSSNNCTPELRREIWKKLSSEWNAPKFANIPTKLISLEDVPKEAENMLQRKTVGRIVVQHQLTSKK